MSVNFNGGMQAQGFGRIKPNANPTPVNNEDVIVNCGKLDAADDNSRPEGTTLKTHIEVHCDGHIYYFSDGQDNGVYISFRVNKDGGYMSYSNEYGTVDFSTNDGYQWSVTGDWKNTGEV